MGTSQFDEKAIFDVARKIDCQEVRLQYLRQVCGDDKALLDRVAALARIHDQQGRFLETPHANVSATLDFPPIAERPGTQIGPYKLIEEIGEGGMGLVYMAAQKEPVRRKVALKIIKPGMDTREVIARFAAEEQALALMDHPNIAKVLDAGTTESGRPFFVMELVNGVPLVQYCDDNNLTTHQRLELFVLICHAVQHAHQKGIIHRDIKPSNILVTMHDGVPVPKIIDFGIAKAINQQLTASTVYTSHGQMIGTPLYMSPEQAEHSGLDIDTRSDVYSLGVLLFELLTGSTPFDGDQLKDVSYDEVRRLIREQEPPRPSTRISTLGKAATTASEHRRTNPVELSNLLRHEVDWIVMKALEKDRTRRYQTARDFARDIQRYLNDEPVEACPPSTAYRLKKFTRRHKTGVLATAAVGLALILGAGVAAGQAYRATKAEKLAEEQLQIATAQERLAKEQTQLAKKQKQLAEAAAEREGKLRVEAERQRDRAQKATQEAEAAREQSEAVTNYLVQAFLQPVPPSDARGVRAVEILDHAAGQLDTSFEGDSPLKAQLLFDLCMAYWNLGFREKSSELDEKSFEMRERLSPLSPLEQLDALNDLAFTFLQAGNTDKAFKYAKQATEIQQASIQPDHPLAIRAKEVLFQVVSGLGRTDEAVCLGEEVLAAREKTCGPADEDMITTMVNLANVYLGADRLNDAIRLYEEATNRCVASGRQVVAPLRINLAVAYHEAGRDEDAARVAEDFLPESRKFVGEEHYFTLTMSETLAAAFVGLGRYEEAIKIFQETLAVRTRLFGPENRERLKTLGWLGKAQAKASHYDEALRVLEEAVSLATKVAGAEDAVTLSAMSWLAYTYAGLGRQEEALALYEQVFPLQKKTSGPDHRLTLAFLIEMGRVQIESGKSAEAEPLLIDAYQRFSERRETSPTPYDEDHCRKAAEQLVQLYEKSNQPEKATAWKEKRAALTEEPKKDEGNK